MFNDDKSRNRKSDFNKLLIENEKLKAKLECMSKQNTQLKSICKFFAEENSELKKNYNKLIQDLRTNSN